MKAFEFELFPRGTVIVGYRSYRAIYNSLNETLPITFRIQTNLTRVRKMDNLTEMKAPNENFLKMAGGFRLVDE